MEALVTGGPGPQVAAVEDHFGGAEAHVEVGGRAPQGLDRRGARTDAVRAGNREVRPSG